MDKPKVQQEGEPAVTRIGILDMQVCVPKTYTDEQVLSFAESNNPCGTQHGWQIRRQHEYPEVLGEQGKERGQCMQHPSHCHIMLDA